MRVFLTFDVEVWCNSWQTLDADFAASFERYVYGRSSAGQYALPRTLEVLDKHGLKGVFFVEPLFAARFGIEALAEIVNLIKHAGQEIQLHLHPEWTDEALTPLLPDVTHKRQHLTYYSGTEQQRLVQHGLRLLAEAGADRPNAFRAGSFSCNAETFNAVIANGLAFDSSIDSTMATSQPGSVQAAHAGPSEPFVHDTLGIYPMSVFRDGFGRLRHAQIGACSVSELTQAMTRAKNSGWQDFVILSHNFEMMVPNSSKPDTITAKRFDSLCGFLSENAGEFETRGFHHLSAPPAPRSLPMPQVGAAATSRRYLEQIMRRTFFK